MCHFRDRGTEDIYDGEPSRKARQKLPRELWETAQEKLDTVLAASAPSDLGSSPGNHLQKMRGAREGQWSIRINQQYRICFEWAAEGAINLEVVDYH